MTDISFPEFGSILHLSHTVKGERCTMCNQPAAKKVEEVIFDDDPVPVRHPWTSYLCLLCFGRVMGPCVQQQIDDARSAIRPQEKN